MSKSGVEEKNAPSPFQTGSARSRSCTSASTVRCAPLLRWAALALAAAMALNACAPSSRPGASSAPAAAPAWAAAITPDDHERLRRLPEAWTSALAEARAGGYGAGVADLGALADPDAALSEPAPPPGRYRCRTVKIGTRGGTLAFVAYGWFECEIVHSGEGLWLHKLTGSQRQHGALYPDGDRRLVFLGTLALGNETSPPPYGADAERNVVGVMERVAPRRWRLVQPWPHFESELDLLELEPR